MARRNGEATSGGTGSARRERKTGGSGGESRGSTPAPGPVLDIRAILAVAVFVLVAAVTLWARVPAGAGVYYDDGVYLGLARSLAEGHGYVYGTLPGAIPGVKYPPLYPGILAVAWKLFPSYPENLGLLKAINAGFAGLAATFTFLLFAGGDARRDAGFAAVAVFGFLATPSLAITTALLSEPLFLALAGGALLAAGRSSGPSGPDRRALWSAAGLAAAAFLTRSVGVALFAAVAVGLLLRRPTRRAARGALLAAVVPCIAWLGWSAARAGDVPAVIRGQYGAYGGWVGRSLSGGIGPLFERLGEVARANLGPFSESLRLVWIPRTPDAAAAFLVLVVLAASLAGAVRAWRRNPALALFPAAYLGLVFVWPYEPYRFYWALLPLLSLFALDGILLGWTSLRREFPRWGPVLAGVAAVVLGVNAVQYQAQGLGHRAWAGVQMLPERAFGPLADWIEGHVPGNELVASGLDPYLYWATGRPAVPSWQFLASDYGRYARSDTTLARQLDQILETLGPRWVAVVTVDDNKASETLRAFARVYPERATRAFETGGSLAGAVYRVAPPGESVAAQGEEGRSAPARPPGDAEESAGSPGGAAVDPAARPSGLNSPSRR